MKFLVVCISGAADQPCEELGGKTPFELAKLPHLHAMTKTGRMGQVKLLPERFIPNVDASLIGLLGYDVQKTYTGRAPLEAANLELKLEENEVPFRVNFVTEYDGKLSDPTAGKITHKEARALLNFLNKKLASGFVRFFAGSKYRHIAVIKDSHGFEALSARTQSPHEIVGQPIEDCLPKGPGSELIKKLMYDAKLLLQDHEINQVRVDLKENPANMIWFWGQGTAPRFEKFNRLSGLSGAIVSHAEYAKGIGRLAGLTVLEVEEPAEDFAEIYEKQSRIVLDALNEKDYVCVHLTDCDDASWSGDVRAKISALEAFDYFVLSKVKNYMEKVKDVRLLVTPAYTMPWKARRRVNDYVPFMMAGKNIMPDDTEKFSELVARTCETKVKGTELMPLLYS